jgi:hypothetical protein
MRHANIKTQVSNPPRLRALLIQGIKKIEVELSSTSRRVFITKWS